ncbi:hypothetical protein BH23CHL7_BH23CHL7_20230 [soil metagenome]
MIEPLLQAERLLLHGLVDQAEALYRSTVEADPRNAIAHVGLARVALEHGREAEAYGHVCHALEIDSRNAIARRLEARLSEILAARGEPVERPAAIMGAETELRPTVVPADPRPPAPATTEAPADERPSTTAAETSAEQAVFARNRSMADHRQMEDQRHPAAQPAPGPGQPTKSATPRRGLLRRLLGR